MTIHTEALRLVRDEISALEAQIAELRTVEQFHARRASQIAHGASEAADGDDSSGEVAGIMLERTGTFLSAVSLQTATRLDAAIAVLKAAGEEMTTAEIVAVLTRLGFGRELQHKQLYNSVFTALTRTNKVQKIGEGRGQTWKLKELEEQDGEP